VPTLWTLLTTTWTESTKVEARAMSQVVPAFCAIAVLTPFSSSIETMEGSRLAKRGWRTPPRTPASLAPSAITIRLSPMSSAWSIGRIRRCVAPFVTRTSAESTSLLLLLTSHVVPFMPGQNAPSPRTVATFGSRLTR
jgi:hypothetical protein